MGIAPKEDGGGNKIKYAMLDDETLDELTRRCKTNRKTKNEWRSTFALIVLCGFLVIIAFVVFADQTWGSRTDAPTLLTTVGTLISSPLSFIIGYYYKGKDSK